jgi:hypothetical protein
MLRFFVIGELMSEGHVYSFIKLLLMVLMLTGAWLIWSDATLLIGLLLSLGAAAGMVVLARRENSRPLDHDERAAWESVRAKGKRHYLLRSVMYGFFLGLIFMAYQLFSSRWRGEPFAASHEFLLIIFFILLYIFGSYYAAIRKWSIYEDRYKESSPQAAERNNSTPR